MLNKDIHAQPKIIPQTHQKSAKKDQSRTNRSHGSVACVNDKGALSRLEIAIYINR